MSEVLQVLEERGFIKQRTHQEPLSKQLEEPTTFYIGFDATADSLHVGHLLPIMVMAHMRRYGHRPIAVVGGGTTMIGDPSGKTEMRQLLSADTISAYAQAIGAQIQGILDSIPGPPGPHGQQCRLAAGAELYRSAAGYRGAFLRQPHAHLRVL